MQVARSGERYQAYHGAIEAKCVESKLVDFEMPKKYSLIPPVDGVAAWTPENDLLTAAMKLKRP
eukprot:243065-Amphidinium_carterae.1